LFGLNIFPCNLFTNTIHIALRAERDTKFHTHINCSKLISKRKGRCLNTILSEADVQIHNLHKRHMKMDTVTYKLWFSSIKTQNIRVVFSTTTIHAVSSFIQCRFPTA